jgi:hypothetical protein
MGFTLYTRDGICFKHSTCNGIIVCIRLYGRLLCYTSCTYDLPTSSNVEIVLYLLNSNGRYK